MFQAIIHGRGGQGAKTMAQLLAEAAIKSGRFAQAYPEFGPERTGAPVRAFLRISAEPILTKQPIADPSLIVVLDESLLFLPQTLENHSKEKETILLINTAKEESEIRKELRKKSFLGRVYTVDAKEIAFNLGERVHFSAPVMGRIVKLTEQISLSDLKRHYEKKFTQKLGEDLLENNLKAMEEGYYGL